MGSMMAVGNNSCWKEAAHSGISKEQLLHQML